MKIKSKRATRRWVGRGMAMTMLVLILILAAGNPGIKAPKAVALENYRLPLTDQPQTTQAEIAVIKQGPPAQLDHPSDIVYITALPEFPIMDLQTEAEFTLGMQNISGETWRAGDYSLVNISGQDFSPWSQVAMDIDVPPGHHIEWRVPVAAPDQSGIYRTTWQFSYKGELAGPEIWVDLIVVPGGSTAAFRATIQGLIGQALQSAGEKIAQGRAKIREVITEVVGGRVRPVFINPME